MRVGNGSAGNSEIAPGEVQPLPTPKEFEVRGCPVILTEDVPACPVCESLRFTDFAAGFDYELLSCANCWRFVQCSACGHVWLNPRPAVEALEIIYPPAYYAYNYSKINPLARNGKAALDRMKMKKILSFCPKRPQTYLDIGCGDGRFLKVLEEFGLPRTGLYGLELDERIVRQLSKQGYAGVFCERAETVEGIPESRLDLITMFHVIEHVDNPASVVRRIRSWLSPGGVFALETPNLDSLDARMFQKSYWGGYHIPRHWNLFTPASISRLLEDNNLEVVAIRYQTGHSFWMYSLHHTIRYVGGSRPRLGSWFDPMKSVLAIAGFTAFDIARGALGAKTSAMLVIARKK